MCVPAYSSLEGDSMTDEYRILATASRDLHDRGFLREQLANRLALAIELHKRLVIVHGDCPTGGDKAADIWGKAQARQGMPVRVEAHPAKGHPTEDFGEWPWCGPERNKYMVGLGADECLAFIDRCTSLRCRRPDVHGSHGTIGCANLAEQAGITVVRFEMWKETR